MSPEPPRYRIGIVGCGGIAHRHLEGYRLELGALGEVVAGCDPNQDALHKFCDNYSLPHRYTSPKELFESGHVDVISLLTPPAVRREVIVPAIEHGIHLLVEKPFAENISDARSFVEAAERQGTMLAVNQQTRFMPDLLVAKGLVDSGQLGDIRFVSHDHLQNRARTTGWRGEEQRLEISIFSIHILDRIRWLAGKTPQVVTAVTRTLDQHVRGETYTALTIQFEGGTVGTMVSNWHALTLPECRLRVEGTAGSLLSVKRSLVDDEATLTVHRPGDEVQSREYTKKNAFTHAMGESMKRLLLAIKEGKPPVHSGRDNLDTMWIVDAAYLSASRGGAPVTRGEKALPV